MPRPRKVGDLEIPADLALQRATWTLQRVAWCLMAATLVAALLGLFGGGPFGPATVGPAGGPRVEYPRACRLRSPTSVDVFARPGGGGEVRVWVALEYADRAEVVRVDPAPVRVESSPDGLIYVAKAAPPGELARLRFTLNPNRPGPLRGRVRPGDGPALDFIQFVYP